MSVIKQFLADPKLLLNAVGEGIYGFDLSGNAVFINPAAERMTGWKSAELLGKKSTSITTIVMPMAARILRMSAISIRPCLMAKPDK